MMLRNNRKDLKVDEGDSEIINIVSAYLSEKGYWKKKG